jgi:hypothetical protein
MSRLRESLREVSREKMERLHQQVRTGTISPQDRELWVTQWWRIILRMMRHRMKHTQHPGFHWRDGTLHFSSIVHEDTRSLFFYYLDWVMVEATGSKPLTSLNLYHQLSLQFWRLKSCWELWYRGGVAGIDPHTTRGKRLGAALVDYHYWRALAQDVTGETQPLVGDMIALAKGEYPEYERTETECKHPAARPRNEQRWLSLWCWFDEVLHPHHVTVQWDSDMDAIQGEDSYAVTR